MNLICDNNKSLNEKRHNNSQTPSNAKQIEQLFIRVKSKQQSTQPFTAISTLNRKLERMAGEQHWQRLSKSKTEQDRTGQQHTLFESVWLYFL